MKRIFESVALCLAIAGAGLTTVSCDSDTITQILTEVLGNLLNTGETYSYSGSATLECLEGTYEPMNYKSVAKGTAKLQVNLTSSNTGTLTIQGFNLDKASMSSITISGLVMTTNNNQSQTTLALGENSAFGQNDSFTYNGKTYPASNLYIEEATATSEQLKLKMTIYFGEGMTDAVNLIYSGQAVSE